MNAPKTLVPEDFLVPDFLENNHFRLRMLSINDVVKDYDAVITSIERLHKTYASSSWPSQDLTLEQNLIDLGWHQKEFQRRTSFAYTVASLDESQILGCVYMYPSYKADYDALITMWVRESAFEVGLDAILFKTVKQWVEKVWPFNNVAYVGREISWDQWNALTW